MNNIYIINKLDGYEDFSTVIVCNYNLDEAKVKLDTLMQNDKLSKFGIQEITLNKEFDISDYENYIVKLQSYSHSTNKENN